MMRRTSWRTEAARRHYRGQSTRYIAFAIGVDRGAVRRFLRPLTQRGRLHSRPLRLRRTQR